jgi:hypothetical protein
VFGNSSDTCLRRFVRWLNMKQSFNLSQAIVHGWRTLRWIFIFDQYILIRQRTFA